MHDNDRVAIEARLEGKRGPASWQGLCELFSRPDWEKKPGAWVPEANGLLAGRLSDDDRTWPIDWLKKKKPPAATALVRHLEAGLGTVASYRRMLAQLATLDATTMPPLGVFTYTGHASHPRELSDDEATTLVQRLELTPLHTIRLRGDTTPATLWRALARDAATAGLRSLHVESHADDAALAALLGSTRLRGLRELSLEERPHLGPRATARLAALSPHLERLTLSFLLQDPTVIEALGQADWPALRHLALQRNRVALAPGLGPLLDRAPGLASLDLSSHRFPATIGDLLAGRRTPRLERLAVSFNELPADALARALSAPMLDDLRELRIDRSQADAACARAIGRMPLERLDAALVPDPAFWQELARHPLDRLHTLRLGSPGVDGGPALAALATAPLPALRTLDLAGADLTHADLDCLERAPWFPQLRSLIDGWEVTAWTVPPMTDQSAGARFAALHWALFRP